MSKNGYLARKEAAKNVYMQAAQETYLQYALDVLCVALSSPEIMGRDAYGPKRLERVMEGWGKAYEEFYPALSSGAEADVMQEKLDACLTKALGENCLPFEQRYEWLKKQRYGK